MKASDLSGDTAAVPTFNLLDSPWVSCLMRDGATRDLSLTEVLLRSGEIAQISGESPHQAAAVLRTILAAFWRGHLTHGALASARTNRELWWSDLFEDPDSPDVQEPVLKYLEDCRERFDLVGSSTPFMQVADLHKANGGFEGVSRLIPEAESDYLTMRAGDGLDELSLPEAARWLLTVHAYDYSGIKPGAVGDPRVKGGKGFPIGPGWTGQIGLVILHGNTLGETLLLNTHADLIHRHAKENDDRPAWERPPQTAEPRHPEASTPTGACDALTWQSRRIRLHLTGDKVTGVLVSNGDKINNKNQFADPMTGYRYSSNQSSKAQQVFMPREHEDELTIWRGVPALLVREGVAEPASPKYPLDRQPATVEWLHRVGMEDIPDDRLVSSELVGAAYGAQQSSHANTISARLPVQLNFLTQKDPQYARTAVQSVQTAMNATLALGQFAGALAQAAGGDYAFNPGLRQRALQALDDPFKDWLAYLGPKTDLDRHQQAWQHSVRRVVLEHAQTELTGTAPAALIGRLAGQERPQLVSASTAWSQLHKRLREALPLTVSDITPAPTTA